MDAPHFEALGYSRHSGIGVSFDARLDDSVLGDDVQLEYRIIGRGRSWRKGVSSSFESVRPARVG